MFFLFALYLKSITFLSKTYPASYPRYYGTMVKLLMSKWSLFLLPTASQKENQFVFKAEKCWLKSPKLLYVYVYICIYTAYKYIYIYILHIYIYIYILHIYIYIYILYIYIYIYIYIISFLQRAQVLFSNPPTGLILWWWQVVECSTKAKSDWPTH